MEVNMGKEPSAMIPVIMSLGALVLVAITLAIHGLAPEPDEGAVAHLWQLLMVAQLPVIAFFAFRWLRRTHCGRVGTYENSGARELGFWIGKPFDQRPATVGNGSMVAFSARSWRAVDEFCAAALANGGCSDGAPGVRPHYGPDFYAAYVRDVDGNKLAAVCRGFTKEQ